MRLPELPVGMEWFTTEGERVFPEFDADGNATGRFFCYLMSKAGEQVASYGIAFDEHSDLPALLDSGVIQFQQKLQETTHGPAQS